MKVIDLLNKIANNEIKQGTKFKIDGCAYIYNNGYIAKDDGNKTMEIFYISQRLLNDEIEIIEEVEDKEYEDIEEIDNNEFCMMNNTAEIFELYKRVDKLIRNQKKIIERLNK